MSTPEPAFYSQIGYGRGFALVSQSHGEQQHEVIHLHTKILQLWNMHQPSFLVLVGTAKSVAANAVLSCQLK